MLGIRQQSEVSKLAAHKGCALSAALRGAVSVAAFCFNADRGRSTGLIAELYMGCPIGLGVELSITSQQFCEACIVWRVEAQCVVRLGVCKHRVGIPQLFVDAALRPKVPSVSHDLDKIRGYLGTHTLRQQTPAQASLSRASSSSAQ